MKRGAVLAGVVLGLVLVSLAGSASAVGASRTSDTALAKHAALTLSDFPSGWRTSSSSSSSSDALAKSIPACRSFEKVTQSLKGAEVRSGNRDFAQNNSSVSNSVSVFATAKVAKAAVDAFARGSVSTCLQKLLTASIAKSESSSGSLAHVKSVQVGRLSVDPIGDRTVAYQAAVTLQLGSLTPSIDADFQVVQVKRAATLFSFVGVDSDLRSTLLNAVVQRLQVGGSSSASPTTTTTAPKGSALGATLKTPSGNSLTVFSYEQPATGLNQFLQPQQPNDEFAAIDVQGCAGASSASLNPFDFALQMPDNTRRQPTFGKDPALNSTDLAPGDCVRGWVTFEVPAGTRAASVVYSAQGSSLSPTILKWAVG